MKVVHITTSSKGGAGIAAFRLHEALRKLGVSSAYISRDKTIDFKGHEVQDEFMAYKKPTLVDRTLEKLKTVFAPSLAEKLSSEFENIKGQLHCEIATLPFSGLRLEDHPLVKEADIVHLHWVSEILDYQRFFSDLEKPMVWTFHDMNPFMGIFHYQLDELQNPKAGLFNKKIKQIKKKAIGQIGNAAVVTPSKWLLESARDSGIFNHFYMLRTIANGIDTELFAQTTNLEARKNLNLGASEKVFLFTAAQLEVERKGMRLLQEALEKVKHDIVLLTMGKGRLGISNKKVKVIPLGYMSNPREIANCYAAADMFLLPSLEDNLPNTMLESFSSGTPVIAYSTGGMKEHIRNGFNGILVSQMNSEALTKAVNAFCEGNYSFDANEIRNYAAEHFNRESQAKKYLDLYKDLLTQ